MCIRNTTEPLLDAYKVNMTELLLLYYLITLKAQISSHQIYFNFLINQSHNCL